MNILNLNLPHVKFELKSMAVYPKTVLLIAGGRKPQDSWLKTVAKDKNIYCADKGIESCLKNSLTPKLLCGDADSSNLELWEEAKRLGATVKLYDSQKDDTDLQILLNNMPNNVNIIASGIWGGRFDHLFSNIFSLLEHKRKNKVQIVLADHKEQLFLLHKGESLEMFCEKHDIIESLSLLPLDAINTVTLQGVKWNLEKSPLLSSYPYAISNLPEKQKINFTCEQGRVGFYLKYKA